VQVLPRMQPLPAFSLHDQRGRWLTDSELRGHMLLISFGYSRCEAACAEATALMQTLYSAAAQQPLVLLTISLDEADASKAALGAYAARLGATDNNWRVLGGEAAEIKALVGGGFGVYYHNDPNSGAPPLVRDQRVVLVDADGVVRAEYAGARLDAQRIARDIALVQREATSRGLTRSLYDAAHLFVCYPD
jgi:protein SCO1